MTTYSTERDRLTFATTELNRARADYIATVEDYIRTVVADRFPTAVEVGVYTTQTLDDYTSTTVVLGSITDAAGRYLWNDNYDDTIPGQPSLDVLVSCLDNDPSYLSGKTDTIRIR
jgi:hypothetical protein